MRKQAGFTLVELVTGMGLMSLLVLGSMSLCISSLRSFQRTTNDVTMTDQNARALRKISETIRQAVSVTITNSGQTVTYSLPAMNLVSDPVTGEKEETIPPVSDGVIRTYNVNFSSGNLTDQNGKILVQNIYGKDPDPTSTLYNQAYQPFQLGNIDTRKAITINLITRTTSGMVRTMRMKTTAILHNLP